jgi:DNA-directed RNA polymerase specialized sigma subunit
MCDNNIKTAGHITKEQFLDNTTETELFCIIHEFKEKYNEMMREENKEELILLDEDIRVIAEHMITDIKSQVWLP